MPVQGITPIEIFSHFDQRLRAGAPELASTTATYLFDLSGDDGGLFHIVVSGGQGIAGQGAVDNPDVTFRMSSEILTGLRSMEQGALAFMSGQLDVHGDESLAVALAPFWLGSPDLSRQPD
jgi:putative sterol carrier protein